MYSMPIREHSTRVCLQMSGRATANSVWAGLDLRDGFFGRVVEGGYRDCWFLVVIDCSSRLLVGGPRSPIKMDKSL